MAIGYRGGGAGVTKHTDMVGQPITNDGAYYSATVPTQGSQPTWSTEAELASSNTATASRAKNNSTASSKSGGSAVGASVGGGSSSSSSSSGSSASNTSNASNASSGGNSGVGYWASDETKIPQISVEINSMMHSGVPSAQIVEYIMVQNISNALKADLVGVIEENSGTGSIRYF